jgi:hypothetical protein
VSAVSVLCTRFIAIQGDFHVPLPCARSANTRAGRALASFALFVHLHFFCKFCKKCTSPGVGAAFRAPQPPTDKKDQFPHACARASFMLGRGAAKKKKY